MVVKLAQIAQECGVSISTVSRALNNDSRKPVNSETAQRIFITAKKLGYFSARPTPEFNRPLSIACVLSSESDNFTDAFFKQIFMGIQDESLEHGFNVCHTISSSNSSDDRIVEQLTCGQYDGIILLGRVHKCLLDALSVYQGKILYVGLNKLDMNFDEVICDASGIIEAAVEYIVSCGHKRIGYIGPIPDSSIDYVNEYRFDAFCVAMKKHNLPLCMEYCRNIILTSRDAYLAARNMIAENSIPDALLCANDNAAIAVISAFAESGYSIPEDISVVGTENIELSEFVQPHLTTVDVPKYDLGRFAVKILHDRIIGGHRLKVVVQLPYQMVIRDSCVKRVQV